MQFSVLPKTPAQLDDDDICIEHTKYIYIYIYIYIYLLLILKMRLVLCKFT